MDAKMEQLILVTGPSRKRKVHDTCGDDRTCEPEQRPAYYYDRVQISM